MSADLKIIAPGQRYRIKSRSGAAIAADNAPNSKIVAHLPQGAIVVAAEAQTNEDGVEFVRIGSPGGWTRAQDLELTEAAPSLKLDYDTFLERHTQPAPGDHYGLTFPFTLQGLREAGADFLTAAFRAAGTISQDNAVTEIVEIKPLGIMGASENAFLTVAYAKDEPGLHNDLFIKAPPEAIPSKFLQSSSSQSEVAMLRLSRTGRLPVTVAKYYYGDYCTHTTNYILITERIRYGATPIEPAHRKGRDHLVPDVEEHYQVLVQALARLAAAHKTGALGPDIERDFPFARAARKFDPIPDAAPRMDRLIDFITRVAPQLFPKEARDPAFLARWKSDILFGLEHKDAVIEYLHQNIDYTALCHINLNVDNCWFWRDEVGVLHAGLLDWGGVGQLSIAQALSSMLMMPEPELYLKLERDVITAFIAEYARLGGQKLNADELRLQYKASVYSTALFMIVTIIVDALSVFPEDAYASMQDRFDPRLQESGFCSAIVWIDNMLREWLDDLTPGDACREILARSQAQPARETQS